MIVFVSNKSVLFRLSMCTVTLTRSPGRPDRNTSTKYLKRSRRAHMFITMKYLRRSRRAHINYNIGSNVWTSSKSKNLARRLIQIEPQILRRTARPPRT
jgi:hypothetical protein